VVRRLSGTPPHDVNEHPCFSLSPQLADQVITNPLDSDTTDDGQSHGGYSSREIASDSSYLSVPGESSACDTDDNHEEDGDDFRVAASLSQIQAKTGEREASLEQTQMAVRNLKVTPNPSHPKPSFSQLDPWAFIHFDFVCLPQYNVFSDLHSSMHLNIYLSLLLLLLLLLAPPRSSS
jgi:hypothetical protein